MSFPKTWPEDVRLLAERTIGNPSRRDVNKVLKALKQIPGDGELKPIRLAFCATFTLDPMEAFIQFEMAKRSFKAEIKICDVNVVEQNLLDSDSQMHSFKPDVVIVLWRLEEFASDLVERPWKKSSSERASELEVLISRLSTFLGSFSQKFSKPFFISTFPPLSPIGRGLYDSNHSTGINGIRAGLNEHIRNLAERYENLHILDFAYWMEFHGRQTVDKRMHFFARQPISASYIADFSGFIARSLNPLLTPSKKLLVLDLDNTLWGGILGEDGVSNLHYGQEYPGNIFRSIQLAVLTLKDQGVLLALVSKNNESEVKEAFDILSDMPLRLSDFSATRINWKPKSSNIRSISAELNLGLDSFVFVDDSAFEREEVRSSIPEIVILNDNESALHILEAITESELFDGYQSTHADTIRIRDYEHNKLRQELRDDSVDLEDYLHSLELTVTNQFIESAQRGRALQMLAKTNQFNVTTRRHNASELDDIISAEGSIVIMTSLRDKFGDQGLIGLAIVIAESNEVASVDSFLLSCRALGRGVEHALWASLVSRVVKAGFSTLKASYIPTSRNMQVAEIFDKFGMIEVAKIDESIDRPAKNYALRLPYFPKVPDWLEINEK